MCIWTYICVCVERETERQKQQDREAARWPETQRNDPSVRMLTTGESRRRVCGCLLHCSCHFPLGLNMFQIKCWKKKAPGLSPKFLLFQVWQLAIKMSPSLEPNKGNRRKSETLRKYLVTATHEPRMTPMFQLSPQTSIYSTAVVCRHSLKICISHFGAREP